MKDSKGLYIALISVHGLIRGDNAELGRDADTGGQVRYVLDLARALSDHPDVARVDLLTRQILSIKLDPQYSEHIEQIADRAWIVRLPCGPHKYLRKESLWPHLPQFVDHALRHFREIGRAPDVVHGHYADAGAVGVRLSQLLNSMLVFTGHSLGRIKKARLLEKGQGEEVLEQRYKITRRIRAEEGVLQAADMIIASTDQEVDEQYGMYTTNVRRRVVVVHPGINFDRFRPQESRDQTPPIAGEIDRFLENPHKPMILALQRADDRKNLATLIRAFGESEYLRRLANLVLLIGARDDIRQAPSGQKRVLEEMLLLIDRYDLYGSVAYPKSHCPDDVAPLYRLAAKRRGVFVNPALTEPFGLTLIEAAASGLPIVATNDGGPKAIIGLCRNGLLVDPLDPKAIADALTEVLSDRTAWRRRSRAGIAGADRYFSWKGHVDRYLRNVHRVQRKRSSRRRNGRLRDGMIVADRLLVTDIDNTLLGDEKGLRTLLKTLECAPGNTVIAVATGRVIKSARRVLREWNVPPPDVLITSVGSEIHYGPTLPVEDAGWRRAIAHHWEPDRLRETLKDLPGLRLQPKGVQRQFKLSYYVDARKAPSFKELRALLKAQGFKARVIFSHDRFLDLLPYRAGKGAAVSYLMERWGLGFDQVLVAGDSGNDTLMFQIGVHGVIVGNHSPELRKLRDKSTVFFAEATNALGIVEGIRHFGFLEEGRE